MAISFGGDPENYMDPPQMSHSQIGDSAGGSFVAGLFELLGIHRNVARGPKPDKTKRLAAKSTGVTPVTSSIPAAGEWLDVAGASLASQDLTQNSGPLKTISLPPSSARQGI